VIAAIAAEIGGALHRRQAEPHRPFAARRNDAIEANPQRPRIALEGEFDGPPGQRLGLAIEHPLGGLGRPVARARRPPGRIARPALPEPPLRIAADLFLQGILQASVSPSRLQFRLPLQGAKGAQFIMRVRQFLVLSLQH
jgi:hypothetical protein